MKAAPLILAAFLFYLPAARADLTLVQAIESPKTTENTTIKIKGSKTRLDLSAKTSMIADRTSGELINLLHADKTYNKLSDREALAFMVFSNADGSRSPLKPTATGKKATVGGFEAEEYTADGATLKLTLWLSKAVPDYQALLKEMNGAFSQGLPGAIYQTYGVDFSALPGFPVQMKRTFPDSSVTATLLSISTKPIPDADFEIPADYKEVSPTVLTPPAAAVVPEKKK